MNSETMVESVETAEELSGFQKVIGVFTSPRKTFESVDLKPTWLLPMIILAVVNLGFIFTVQDILLNETLAQQEESMIERGMEAEQIDQALAATAAFMKFGTPAMAAIISVIMTLIVAGVFLFVGNVMLGGASTFKKVFAVTAHSWLVIGLSALIILPVILSKESMQVTFSLASLMSEESRTTFLYQLLAKIDIFWIAWIAVYSIGLAVIYKKETQKMATAVVAVYAVYAVGASVLTSLFS